MVFKILSTMAVFLLITAWAWRNFRFLNDWMVDKTGIGVKAADRVKTVTTTTDTGTTVTYKISTSNTAPAATSDSEVINPLSSNTGV